jgi:hypothetical protein
MGWARLHEIPNLDRQALVEVLDPVEAPLTPSLPESPLTPASALIAQIHASQLPTTNLERLSEALDHLEPLEESEPIPMSAPAFDPPPEVTPATEPLEPPPSEHLEPPRRSKLLPLLLVVLFFGAAAWGITGFRGKHLFSKFSRAKTAPFTPAPITPAPQVSSSMASTKPVPAEPTAAEVPRVVPPPPPVEAPKPPKQTVFSKQERLSTVLQGDWKQALVQGQAHLKTLSSGWVLRLEIACQGSTVQHAAELLKDRDPDLFLLPMAMRDGRTCYQVFLGHWGSEAAAKSAAKKLPGVFLLEGNRPKPFRVGQIPDHQ